MCGGVCRAPSQLHKSAVWRKARRTGKTTRHAPDRRPAHRGRGGLCRAVRARSVPPASAALRGTRDHRGHRDRPVRPRPGRGGPVDRGRRCDRARLRAFPGGTRNRVRQAARAGAATGRRGVCAVLCATSLGVLIPVLKDAGEISTTFGQLIIGAATIADFGAIILLSLFFSGEGGVGSTLLLLGGLALLALVVYLVVRGAEGSVRIREDLVRLQDTTAQIRVRAAVGLFVGFAAIAEA